MPYTTPTGYTPQTALQEHRHDFGFMVSEANGHRSRDQGTLTGGTVIYAGTVIAKQSDTAGSVTVTPGSGNIGNGILTPDANAPVQPGAQAGPYTVKFDSATTFVVFDPTGKELGTGKTGTAFINQVKFTITAGGTAYAVDDTISVTVAIGTGYLAALNPSAADGSEIAVGILGRTHDCTLSNQLASYASRECEVNLSELIWPSGITTPQQTAALAQLAALGIIAR